MVALSFAAISEEPAAPVPAVWVLHDGKAGMASQALGLAEATGFPFIEKRLAIRFPWSSLPQGLWLLTSHAVGEPDTRLTQSWPYLVISSARFSDISSYCI